MEQLEISLLAPSPPCKGYYNPLLLPVWDATPTFIVLNGMSIHREVRVDPFLSATPPPSPQGWQELLSALFGEKNQEGPFFGPHLKKQVLQILAAPLKKKSKPLEQNLATLCRGRDKKWNVSYQVGTARGREIAWEKKHFLSN